MHAHTTGTPLHNPGQEKADREAAEAARKALELKQQAEEERRRFQEKEAAAAQVTRAGVRMSPMVLPSFTANRLDCSAALRSCGGRGRQLRRHGVNEKRLRQ